jgi:hypothetical protein
MECVLGYLQMLEYTIDDGLDILGAFRRTLNPERAKQESFYR